MTQQKILIIDDDQELTELISGFLIKNDFLVKCHHSGEGAVALIHDYQPDLLILDVMLPSINGVSICQTVRNQYRGSIIMLTALDEDCDEVTGLEVGADDYLSKPVKPRVLLAHIRAQLRRLDQLSKHFDVNALHAFGRRLTINGGTRMVSLDGENVELSSSEFELLWTLAHHAGTVVSRELLYQKIFRLEHDGIDRSIDLRISRIRKKLKEDPRSPAIIKTIRNKGYLLAN